MTKETEHTLGRILERIKVMYLDRGIVQRIPRFVRVDLKSYEGETGDPPGFKRPHFDSYWFYRDIDSDSLLRVRDFNKKIKEEVDRLFSIMESDTRTLKLLDNFIDYKNYLTPREFFQDNSYRLWLTRDIYPKYESQALKETKDYFYSFLKKTANEQITIFDGSEITIPI
jgi:hypothetical protein